MTHLTHLPVEVMSVIGDYLGSQQDLYQVALVNKNCYVQVNPILWRAPAKKDPRCPQYSAIASSVLKCIHLSHTEDRPSLIILGNHIRTLHFGCLDLIQDIVELVSFTPLLKDIALGSTYATDTDLETIAHHCPLLEKVTCDTLLNITDRSIIYLAEHCPQLRDLSLLLVNRMTPNCLASLKGLERLDLKGCSDLDQKLTASHLCQFRRLTDLTTPPYVTTEFMSEFLPTAQKKGESVPLADLISFHIHGTSAAPIDNQVMLAFFQTHPRIQNLALIYSAMDQTLTTTLATFLPHLISLRLNQGHCCFRNSSQPISFTKTFPRLRILCLEGCDINGTFTCISTHIPTLERLELAYCTHLDPLALRHLIKKTHHLSSIVIHCCGAWNHAFPEISNQYHVLYELNKQVIESVRHSTDGRANL